MVHRAFHALPALSTKKGELVNAVYGFLLVLFKAIREMKPDFIAATFDLPRPTFRHKEFAAYKAKRPKAPDELYQQLPLVKRVLRAFKIPIFEKEGFEADDLIGTISRESPRRQVFPGLENIILTGDLDTLQLVDDHTKVYTLKKGLKDTVLYDEKQVRERYGLSPSQLVDFKALRGDPSDNIPGVPGIGEKTAAQLIRTFGTLEALYQKLKRGEAPLKGALKDKLLGSEDQAFFSRQLVEIRRDAPIEFKIEQCQWQDYDREEAVQLLKELEFHTLLSRLPAQEAASPQQEKGESKGRGGEAGEKKKGAAAKKEASSGRAKNLKIW